MHFHLLPKDENLREKWIEVYCATNNRKTGCVCSLHYDFNSYERNLKYELLGLSVPPRQNTLKDGTVLTLHLPEMEEGKYNIIVFCILVEPG